MMAVTKFDFESESITYLIDRTTPGGEGAKKVDSYKKDYYKKETV